MLNGEHSGLGTLNKPPSSNVIVSLAHLKKDRFGTILDRTNRDSWGFTILKSISPEWPRVHHRVVWSSDSPDKVFNVTIAKMWASAARQLTRPRCCAPDFLASCHDTSWGHYPTISEWQAPILIVALLCT